MTIKIKTAKATIEWHAMCDPEIIYDNSLSELVRPCTKTKARIIRESEWRKLMRLVKTVEGYPSTSVCEICEALVALEKKK